jgi:thiamine biosynthesis protein ThiS
MNVRVNGKEMQLAEGMTVKQVLEQRQLSPNVVACELNEKILRRAALGDAVLHDGDVLEILQMIGGG